MTKAATQSSHPAVSPSPRHAQPRRQRNHARSPDKARKRTAPSGVHPVVIEIALGAVLWFLVMSWLTFAWGREVDFNLVVVTAFFIFFLALFLLTASFALPDPRWRQPHMSFRRFLHARIDTATGATSGREVLVQIAALPLTLALGGTLIGIVWVLTH